MDIVLVLLRLIHIVVGVIWFGMSITLVLINPALEWLGDQRYYTELALYTRTRISSLFPIVGGVTTLAGLLLYATGSGNDFSTTGNIVLGIGALAGLGAAIHGGAVTGRLTKEYSVALTANVTPGQAIATNAIGSLRELSAKLTQHTLISTGMALVALIAMASARYL